MTKLLEPTVDGKKTLELLWKRIRQRGDLPGFSKVVTAILGAMHGEDDREFSMTRTVLQDPVLTQRVLRLANSAMYAVFGQGINTVSKAVIVLGTEAIGHLALGLKLVDGLSNASSASAGARREMEQALLAGHIARQIASTASTRDAEEAVVCSMLHGLGRMMTAFYLPDHWSDIQQRCMMENMDEVHASELVLGMGFDEIARQVAKQWGLPESLIASLRDVQPQLSGGPLDHTDWLAAVSTLSSRCARALHDGSATPALLSAIADEYADMLGLQIEQILSAVESAKNSAQEDVMTLPKHDASAASAAAPISQAERSAASTLVLMRGVSDMRSAAGSASISQLVAMALETVHQGLKLHRSLVFLRNRDESRYVARMCFGECSGALLPSLSFGDAYQPDVFHAALASDKMVFVKNSRDAAFVNKLPHWWREALPDSQSFILLPLTVNRQPAGLIYGDWGPSHSADKPDSAELPPLDEIRALLGKALDHRRHLETAWRV